MIIAGASGQSFGWAPISSRVALVGDSITANPGVSSFYWINALNGGHLTLVKNAGVGSEKVAGTLARINNSYTSSPPGLSGLTDLGWVFLRIGTNDVAISSTLASVQADYTALFTAILTYAQKLVVMAVPPFGVGDFPLPQEYSAWIQTQCAANPERMLFIDDCVDLRTGNTQDNSYFPDFVHPNSAGTYLMGVRGAADTTLQGWLSGYSTSPLITSALDVYPAQPQWVVNPLMSGTGGTVGTGFTGVMADNWAIARSAGSMTAACSKVAAAGGDTNTSPWQRISLTAGSGGSGFDITTTLAGRTITTTDPATCQVVLEMRFNAMNTTGMFDFYTEVKHSSGSDLLCPRQYLQCFNAGTITKTVTLNSSLPRDNANTHADAIFRLHGGSESNPATPGSFDFRCVSVRG